MRDIRKARGQSYTIHFTRPMNRKSIPGSPRDIWEVAEHLLAEVRPHFYKEMGSRFLSLYRGPQELRKFHDEKSSV